MRRGLLTTVTASGPITVGNTPVASGSAWDPSIANMLTVAPQNPAARAGVIDTINKAAANAGTVRFLTGTLSGSTFTVAAISAAISMAAGTASHTGLSLTIPAGGMVGIWWAAAGPALYAQSTPGSSTRYALSVSTTPTVGGTYTMTQFSDYVLALQGTGT